MTDTTVIEPNAGDGGSEGLSLRDELAAALTGSMSGTGEAQQSEAGSPPSPATAAKPDKTEPATDGPQRDAQGRFAPKEGVQAAQTIPTEPKTPEAPAAAAQQPSGPPATWSAAAKAEFSKLPPLIQQEVAKREADMERGKAQWQSGAERLNRLDALFAPRAERLRMAGVSPEQAIGQLLAAQDFLERDPYGAIAHLARVSGVDLLRYAQMQGQQQPQAQLPPQLQGLAQDVATLKEALAQQRDASQAEARRGLESQIDAFANDPANKFFWNVAERMAGLYQVNPNMQLKDAYDQACWADPEVRQALLKDQEDQRAAQAADAARAKAAQARQASGSVTGSPLHGASALNGSANPNASVRDDLRAAWEAHAA